MDDSGGGAGGGDGSDLKGSNSWRSGKGVVAVDLGRPDVGEMGFELVPQSEGISIVWEVEGDGSGSGAGSELMLEGGVVDGREAAGREQGAGSELTDDCVSSATRVSVDATAISRGGRVRRDGKYAYV